VRTAASVRRETRGWDDRERGDLPQRSKESAGGTYRLFPRARPAPSGDRSLMGGGDTGKDCPKCLMSAGARLIAQLVSATMDAGLLTERAARVADYFERAVAAGEAKHISTKTIANWITGELFHLLNVTNMGLATIKVSATQLVDLLAVVGEKVITSNTGRHVLEVMFATGRAARDIVTEEGLAQIADEQTLSAALEQVLRENQAAVTQYRQGKETVLRFLVGQVMRATKGKADPIVPTEMLKEASGQRFAVARVRDPILGRRQRSTCRFGQKLEFWYNRRLGCMRFGPHGAFAGTVRHAERFGCRFSSCSPAGRIQLKGESGKCRREYDQIRLRSLNNSLTLRRDPEVGSRMHALLRVPMRELHVSLRSRWHDARLKSSRAFASSTMTHVAPRRAASASIQTRRLTQCALWLPG